MTESPFIFAKATNTPDRFGIILYKVHFEKSKNPIEMQIKICYNNSIILAR